MRMETFTKVIYVVLLFFDDMIRNFEHRQREITVGYTYLLPLGYQGFLLLSAIFGYVALSTKFGKQTTTFLSAGFGIACMFCLGFVLVNMIFAKICLEEELLDEIDMNYRMQVLQMCIFQIVFLAYINFHVLPRSSESFTAIDLVIFVGFVLFFV